MKNSESEKVKKVSSTSSRTISLERKDSPMEASVPDELVLNKIYLIRGMNVMLDRDIAELYGVETKQL